jgi:VanZ family protein
VIEGRQDHFPGISARHERAWIAGGMGFVLLVVYLSLTPDPIRAPTIAHYKTGHIIAYMWLMLWFAQVRASVRSRALIAALLVALGVGLEYAQRLTEHRTFSYSDMIDDAIGVAAGFVLAFTPVGRLFARWEALHPPKA